MGTAATTEKCIGPQEHHNYLTVANDTEKGRIVVCCTGCGDHFSIDAK